MAWLYQLLGSNGTSIANVDTSGNLQVFANNTQNNPLNVALTPYNDSLDAFGRQRTSEARIGFEYHFCTGMNADVFESTAYGAGSAAVNTSAWTLVLSSTTASGTGYWIQAYAPTLYAPGISVLNRFTFCFNQLISNLTMRVGYYSDTSATPPSSAGDGVFLEAQGSAISFVLRTLTNGTSGSEVRVAQNSWNLDRCDGTGPSGYNIDWTTAQHLVMQYEWLGVGVIKLGFETGPLTPTQGTIWAHQFNNINVTNLPWCRTGMLPCRAEIFTTSTTSTAGNLTLINTTSLLEGDVISSRGWRYYSANSGAALKTIGVTSGSLYPVLALRALLTNSITARTQFVPTALSITVATAATTSQGLMWALLINPTPMTGATFAVTNGSSNIAIDNAATATTAVTGTLLASGVMQNLINTTQVIDLTFLHDSVIRAAQNAAGSLTISGHNVLTLAVGPMGTNSGAGAALIASIDWKELV